MVTCKTDGQFSHVLLCAADFQLLHSLTTFKTADEFISALSMLGKCGSFEIGTVGVRVALVLYRHQGSRICGVGEKFLISLSDLAGVKYVMPSRLKEKVQWQSLQVLVLYKLWSP